MKKHFSTILGLVIVLIVGVGFTTAQIYQVNNLAAAATVLDPATPPPVIVYGPNGKIIQRVPNPNPRPSPAQPLIALKATVKSINSTQITVSISHTICAFCNNGGPGVDVQINTFNISPTTKITSKTGVGISFSEIKVGSLVTIYYMHPTVATATSTATKISVN